MVNADEVVGYLYYHWCYNGSYYSKPATEGSYTTFHAYYSTTAPSNYTCDTSDMSYNTGSSTCSNSTWYFTTDVYRQSYTHYKKLFTYERWADFSDWADTAVTASDTRKVETRTVYQLKQASPGEHSYTAQVTAPTCTTQGYTTYTCTACGHSYTGNTAAPKGHSYQNGSCTLCGAQDPNYVPSVTQPVFQLRYPTLTFEDVITMNVFFEASNLEDVVEMGLITYKSEVIDYGVENAEAVIPGYYEASGMYVASTEGIPAKDMGDTYWFAVYAKLSDGSCAYTPLVSYSPAQYAYGQLSDPEMTKLVVAMLNYGAAAQTYFNYRTDSLMNKDLTAAQQASIESYRADMMASVVNADSAKVGIFTNNGGFSRRYPTITFDGAFCIDYFFTPAKTPSGNVSLYYWTQDAYEAAGTLTPANASGKLTMTPDGTGTYRATIEGIAAKDLDKTVYVSADYTSGGTSYCSGVLAYSIGAYCVSQAASTDPMSPFAKATAVYGYYAKQLFY